METVCRIFVIIVMLWVIYEGCRILALEWRREKERRR